MIFSTHLALVAYVIFLNINEVFTTRTWNLHGTPGDGYYISVNIGYPSRQFNLLIDSGSSNLAIAGSSYPGLDSYFEPSKSQTFVKNGTSVEVAYTQGWWKGMVGQDLISIPSLVHISAIMADLSIINSTHGFYVNNSHWQGILGLAYSEIAEPKGYIQSWFDILTYEYPKQTNNRFDLNLCGPQSSNRSIHSGYFSVGDKDAVCMKSQYSTPIHHRWYYEVIITGIDVGQIEIEVPCQDFNSPRTIVDSGTSNLQLSSKSYYYVIAELKLQTQNIVPPLSELFWEGKEAICSQIRSKNWNQFPTLTLFLQHNNFSHFGIRIPPMSYLRPALNVSDDNKSCWILGIGKSHIGTVLGTVLLEGLCLVFNREDGILHFSESSCGPPVDILPILNRTGSTSCDFIVYIVNGPLYAVIIILLLVLLPLMIAFARYIWIEFLKSKAGVNNVPFISLDENNT